MESYTSVLQSPEGIAIDWISRNLYYIDSIKNELGVLSLDGKYQKVLLTEGLVNPRAMVIDIDNRFIFFLKKIIFFQFKAYLLLRLASQKSLYWSNRFRWNK